MSVRWKPLLVLSGVFLVTAIAGVTTIGLVLMNSSSQDILPKARAELQAGEYERAWIQYRRALQSDPKNAAIHEEVAEMFAQWGGSAPADKQAELRQQRLATLVDAARYGTRLVGPRRQLLAEALHDNEIGEATRWAKELIALAPDDLDARFVLAREALSQSPPAVDEAAQQVQAIEAAEPNRPRTAWLKAWLARETRDEDGLDAILEAARKVDPAKVDDPIDRLAQLRLLGFDVQRTADASPETLASRIPAFQAMARTIADEPEAVPGRIDELGDLVGQARSVLMTAAGKADADGRSPLETLARGLDQVVEATYKKALESQRPDLRVYETYANFLIERGQFDESLQTALQGLKLPAASQPAFRASAMALREVAIRAILGNTRDADRFDKAAPHIKAMLASTVSREQAIGHLFHGAICLERSGLIGAEGVVKPATRAETDALRVEALEHLRPAAAELAQVPAAQALYGITLILSKEPTLGRQYLQAARRAGPLEVKYLIWAAWSMIQAGYPEEAQPIVATLRRELGAGITADNEATLRTLEGEIAQARRGPDDLAKAREDYQKALETNPDQTSVELKLAQVDIQLKNFDAALDRIDKLRQAGKATAGSEQMAVVALETAGRAQEARERLEKAREQYPDSGDLATLDAAIKLRADQNEPADAILADFLSRHPDDAHVANVRAAILNERLKKPDEARALLKAQAERAKTPEPWVQLAQFELGQENFPAMTQAIAQIRANWKEAAAADLLDAQFALASRQDYHAAARALDAAVKKDPDNKVAQFWKAQIDERIGAGVDTSRVYEEIARDKPVKELYNDLPLEAAAQFALASQALNNREIDTAISRLGDLLRNSGAAGNATLNRATRWQLVTAYIAKGQWPQARVELINILNDPTTTNDERARAANVFRGNKEENAAIKVLDGVLKVEPTNPAAIVTRAYILSDTGKRGEAIQLVKKSIASGCKHSSVYLMLAALENVGEPRDQAAALATAALDDGITANPGNSDLIDARYKLTIKTSPDDAIAYLEGQAKAPSATPAIRRLLADSYRDQGRFAQAEQTARDLIQAQPADQPRDPKLTALLSRVLLSQAAAEADRGDSAAERAADDKASVVLRQARAEFPHEIAFPRAEWELSMRRRDFNRAVAISQEIDEMAPRSTIGPILRAQTYAAQDRLGEVSQAYGEAVNREPKRLDLKLLLAQTQLSQGRADDCLRLASAVLEADKDQPGAIILKARGLALFEGPPSQVAARREEAVKMLREAIQADPKFSQAYQNLAEFEQLRGNRPQAVQALEDGLKANPDDATLLAMLVQALSETRAGKAPTTAEITRAKAIAEPYAQNDPQGQKALALAIGFQRARQFDLAVPWAKKAAETIDKPPIHQTLADVLLGQAEHTTDPAQARDLFRSAIAEYDKVLKVQAGNVDAINNKAWILHRYLNDNDAALEVAEQLARRDDPATLPAEFLDTLGSIQEAANLKKEAEETYNRGLLKSPNHPFLNFHLGRLIAHDGDRRGEARAYLEKARERGDRLPPALVAELNTLVQQVGN